MHNNNNNRPQAAGLKPSRFFIPAFLLPYLFFAAIFAETFIDIVGIFNEAQVGGLGERDARIVVDYENDSVSLELAAGNGAVSVETYGAESDVTTGEEALWNALTAGHGVTSDSEQTGGDDDIHLDEVA